MASATLSAVKPPAKATRRNRALPGDGRVTLGTRCVREVTADD